MSKRLWLAVAFIVAAGASPARAGNGVIEVTLDHDKIINLPPETATVILGNPTFADVTPIKGGHSWANTVVTAHSFGETNLIAVDSDGKVLDEKELRVLRPKSSLILQKGDARISLACNPDCMPTVQLGDDADYFGKTGAQITARDQLARGEVAAGTSVAGK